MRDKVPQVSFGLRSASTAQMVLQEYVPVNGTCRQPQKKTGTEHASPAFAYLGGWIR